MKRNDVCKIRPGTFEHAARSGLRVNLRIAFVAQDHEAETIGELLQAAEIFAWCDGALRIGWRGDVDRHRSCQRGVIERIEVGQESVGARGRQIDLFAARGACAGAIGRIKRIGHQDGRPAPAFADIARSGDGREKQALPAAVQHQNFGFGIDSSRQVKSCRKPVRSRPSERLDAPGDRIATEFDRVFGQHRADKAGHRVLRLAQ